MARVISTLLMLFISMDVLAECIARAYNPEEEPAKYKILSCGSAVDYVRGLKDYKPSFESWLSERTEIDLAVKVKPLNKNARRILYGRETEYWHYSGQCDALPQGSPVEIDIKQHCCDTSLYLECFLGDVTIEKAY